MTQIFRDWGEASEKYDEIRADLQTRDLSDANEAQTRFDVIDRVVRELLGWQHGQVTVEEPTTSPRAGFVDYVLRVGDYAVVIEAKRLGASFPSPTRKTRLKLTGSLLSSGAIADAIEQAEAYAKDKDADVVVVTNGMCWCYFSVRDRSDERYASLLFPLEYPGQAEQLFEQFAEPSVETGSLRRITNTFPLAEDRLLRAFRFADTRVDRNNIADHIQPALDGAFFAEAILTSPEQLRRCFVTTEARTKFDSTLGIHLADRKPRLIEPAKRIRTGQERGPLQQLVEQAAPSYSPPVTLIIGPVGAGKSTYLKHFELVSGPAVLAERPAHWIYIDFESMGPAANPREFMYRALLSYIEAEHPAAPIDFKSVIQPAYDQEIRALARGPLAPLVKLRDDFQRKVSEHIQSDYKLLEPYVDKVVRFLASRDLCIIVLDNIDLYEDDALETRVFAEGLALSRRLLCNVIVSVRDETFVKHRNDAAFDAYELRKLWLDPPPLKSVISSRLSYSKKILEGRGARIDMANGMVLAVPDLSVFFDIVQRSILGADAGDFVEAMADGNIRRGLSLVRNFLTSGHIEADRALKTYILEGGSNYTFPSHEIFKGTMLGQWRHFREDRAEVINVYDARLGSQRLRLLRLLLLNELMSKAQIANAIEVPVSICVDLMSPAGASEAQVVEVLRFLAEHSLIRSTASELLTEDSSVVLTRCGAHYVKLLARRFVYVEECMFDTAIEDAGVWQTLYELTDAIEGEKYPGSRMELRYRRIDAFLHYLVDLESQVLSIAPGAGHLSFAGGDLPIGTCRRGRRRTASKAL